MEQSKITAIRRYLRTNGVKYFDVQAELIDHFATAVEKAEKDNPDIPFKHALIKAHRSFGGREGFRKYIDAAKKDVRRKTDKMLLNLFVKLFDWPDIILTLAITAFWYFTLPLWTANVDLLYVGLIAAGGITVAVINNFKLKQSSLFMPKHANKYLVSVFYFIIYLPCYFMILTQDERPSHLILVLAFSLMSVVFISFLRIPKLAIAETLKKYPEIA